MSTPNNSQELENIINQIIENEPNVTESDIEQVVNTYNSPDSAYRTKEDELPDFGKFGSPQGKDDTEPRELPEVTVKPDDDFTDKFIKFKEKFDKKFNLNQEEEKEEETEEYSELTYEGTVIGGDYEEGKKIDLSNVVDDPPKNVKPKKKDGEIVDDMWVDDAGNEINFVLKEIPIIEDKKVAPNEDDVIGDDVVEDIKFENQMDAIRNQYEGTELEGFVYDPSGPSLDKQKRDFVKNKKADPKGTVDIMPYRTDPDPDSDTAPVLISKIFKGLTKKETWKKLYDIQSDLKSNWDNNYFNWMYNAFVIQPKVMFNDYIGDNSTLADRLIGGYDGGDAGWLDTNGVLYTKEQVIEKYNFATTTNQDQWAKQLLEDGWKHVYLNNPEVQVGDYYTAELARNIEMLMANKKLLKEMDVHMVKGFKEGDAVKFFGGGLLAVNSMMETLVPAFLSRGWSLAPQIWAPMVTDYNLELAKRYYPELSEEDAMTKLYEEEKHELFTPSVLAAAAFVMERIGFKSIKKALLGDAGKSKFIATIFTTGSTEGITEFGQFGTEIINRALAQGYSMDEALEMAFDQMFSEEGLERFLMGFVGGGFISGGGQAIKSVMWRDKSVIKTVQDNLSKQQSAHEAMLKAKTQNAKDAYYNKIKSLQDELVKFLKKEASKFDYLTQLEVAQMLQLKEEYDNIARERKDIKDNYLKYDPTNPEGLELLKYYDEQLDNINNLMVQIKNKANERLINEGIKKGEEWTAEGTFQIFNTVAELEQHLIDEGFTKAEIAEYLTKDGWYNPNTKKIYINKEVAIEEGAVTVAQHEVVHYIFGASLRDGTGNITTEGVKTVIGFLKLLSKKDLALITQRVNASYDTGTKINKEGQKVWNDPNHVEEYLTAYVDMVLKKEIKPTKTFLRAVGKDVENKLRENGYENIEFNNPNDILSWLNAYVRDIQSNKSPVNRVKANVTGPTMFSSSVDLKPKIDALGKMTKEEWDSTGADEAIVQIFGELDGLIKSKIPYEKPPGFSEEDFIQSTYAELITHIRNFNPEVNDSLFGWINSQIGNKAKNVFKKDDAGTKERFDVSIEDESSFVNDIESQEFVDIDAVITNDITYSQLLDILGIKREIVDPATGEVTQKGDPLYYFIKEGVVRVMGLTLEKVLTNYRADNILDKKFTTKLKKYWKDRLFNKLKKMMGTPGSVEYQDFIKKNGKLLYNLFPQEVFNKSFPGFYELVEENINPTRVKELIAEGKLPKDTNINSGPSLYRKKPYSEVEQEWIDNFLNPPEGQGRPASKQDSLIDLMAWYLGFDATMEVINSEEFLSKHDITDATIATIGMKIDRGANVMFSNSKGEVFFMNSETMPEGWQQDAGKVARYIEDNIGFDLVSPEDLSFILETEFPKVPKEVRELMVLMADTEAIKNMDSKRFKRLIYNNPNISKEVKEEYKNQGTVRYSDKAQQEIADAAEILAVLYGPEIMDVMGYEFLGFKMRVLDPAERKLNPHWKKGDPESKKYLKNPDGSYINGKWYDFLENLKLKVENSESNLPAGLNLALVEKMNKAYKLFKDVEKILNSSEVDENGSNLEWKKAEILKMSKRIKEAGEANIELAKHLAKVMIESDISDVAFLHLMQIQTGITGGFRALTTLDLITMLEGSQKADKNHPHYQKYLLEAKKAKDKKGNLKYKTAEEQHKAAIIAIKTKGEHAGPNANTMAAIADLRARYKKDPSIDLETELNIIFANHGQIHSNNGALDAIDDEGGKTNPANFKRILLTEDRNDMFSPDGKTAVEIVAEKEQQQVMFSNSKRLNDILQENEGVKSEATFSEAQGRIRGDKRGSFWDFIFPPSAYDLELFIYRIIGRDKKGEQDFEFFKETIIEPFEDAIAALESAGVEMNKRYKALIKSIPKIKKNLSKKIPGTEFTYEQAVRVAIWIDQGIDMQKLGLSKADQKILLKAVNDSVELTNLKNGLHTINTDGKPYPPPTEYWVIEGIGYDLGTTINTETRAEYLKDWKKNIEEMFTPANMAKLRAIYGNDFADSLQDMLYRMEYGRSKNKAGRIETAWNNWVNNSVGAIMFINMRSGLLQTISSINFIDWENNTPIKAAKAFANQKQFWTDFLTLWKSDFLVSRRDGNTRTMNEAEISARLKGKKNKAKALLAYLLEKGFTPTQIADSFAIASGGASYYRNQIIFYEKQGMPTKLAEEQALKDWRAKAVRAQQSSRPDLLSEQQAGGLGRIILAFKNTPMQYNRLMIKAIMDLKNNRGKTSTNVSKIAYYGLVQNIIFTSLQNAIFAAFGEDEEFLNEKQERIMSNMIDGILNGLGLTGAVAVMVKNTFLRYRKERKRGFMADHTRTVLEFANLSPTIGSKLREFYMAIRTEQLNQEAIKGMGFNINNPAWNAVASLISAVANVPMDNALKIAQNLLLASKSETEFMDALALTLGWNPWDLGIESEAMQFEEKQKEEKKARQKQCTARTEKGKGPRCKNMTENKSGLCYSHLSQKEDKPKVKTKKEEKKKEVKKTEKPKEVQCKAKTKKGKGPRCKNMTENKSGKCYAHQ